MSINTFQGLALAREDSGRSDKHNTPQSRCESIQRVSENRPPDNTRLIRKEAGCKFWTSEPFKGLFLLSSNNVIRIVFLLFQMFNEHSGELIHNNTLHHLWYSPAFIWCLHDRQKVIDCLNWTDVVGFVFSDECTRWMNITGECELFTWQAVISDHKTRYLADTAFTILCGLNTQSGADFEDAEEFKTHPWLAWRIKEFRRQR